MPIVPFPTRGDIFLDARGQGRALRVTTHLDAGFIVLSVWHGAVCTATVRLSPDDSARLADVLGALAVGAATAPPDSAGGSDQAVAAR